MDWTAVPGAIAIGALLGVIVTRVGARGGPLVLSQRGRFQDRNDPHLSESKHSA